MLKSIRLGVGYVDACAATERSEIECSASVLVDSVWVASASMSSFLFGIASGGPCEYEASGLSVSVACHPANNEERCSRDDRHTCEDREKQADVSQCVHHFRESHLVWLALCYSVAGLGWQFRLFQRVHLTNPIDWLTCPSLTAHSCSSRQRNASA